MQPTVFDVDSATLFLDSNSVSHRGRLIGASMTKYDIETKRSESMPTRSARHSQKEVTIFCDGSSLGNGQVSTRAAAVALLGYQGVWRAVGAYLGQATNQQAEVAAAALGLEALLEPCRVHLFTDSRYVVETMGGRFRRKTNHDWWARLDKAVTRHDVKWEWIRGHDGHLIQEAVDRAARKIAAQGVVDEDVLRDAVDRIGDSDPLNIPLE